MLAEKGICRFKGKRGGHVERGKRVRVMSEQKCSIDTREKKPRQKGKTGKGITNQKTIAGRYLPRREPSRLSHWPNTWGKTEATQN